MPFPESMRPAPPPVLLCRQRVSPYNYTGEETAPHLLEHHSQLRRSRRSTKRPCRRRSLPPRSGEDPPPRPPRSIQIRRPVDPTRTTHECWLFRDNGGKQGTERWTPDRGGGSRFGGERAACEVCLCLRKRRLHRVPDSSSVDEYFYS